MGANGSAQLTTDEGTAFLQALFVDFSKPFMTAINLTDMTAGATVPSDDSVSVVEIDTAVINTGGRAFDFDIDGSGISDMQFTVDDALDMTRADFGV